MMRVLLWGWLFLAAVVTPSAAGDKKKKERSVKELIEALNSGDAKVRRVAAFELEARTPPALEAMPELVKLIQDPDAEVRFAVFQALSAFGVKAREAIPPLIKAARQESFPDRWRVLHVLSRLETDDEQVLRLAIDAARDKNDKVRATAFQLIEVLGPKAKEATPSLIEALKEGKEISGHAASALGALGTHATPAIPLLIEMLSAKDDFRVGSAAKALVAIAGADAAPLLDKALASLKHRERSYIIEALATLGPKAAMAIPTLAAALKDEEHFVRLRAAEALAAIGSASVPVLLNVVIKEDEERREMAGMAIAHIAAQDAAAFDDLVASLAAGNADTREAAAFVLSRLGQDAKKAAAALSPLLKDKDRRVAWQAAVALVEIGEEKEKAILPALVEGLKQENRQRAAMVARTIARLGPAAKEAIPVLLDVFKAADGLVAGAAVEALGAISPGKEVIAPLIESLADKREAAPMVPLPMVTARQFKRIGPDVIAPLINALGSARAGVRAYAAAALGEFGVEAKAAVPALIRNLKDTDKFAALSARRALERIDPDEAEAAGVK